MLSAAVEADWSRTAAVISGFQMETTGGFASLSPEHGSLVELFAVGPIINPGHIIGSS